MNKKFVVGMLASLALVASLSVVVEVAAVVPAGASTTSGKSLCTVSLASTLANYPSSHANSVTNFTSYGYGISCAQPVSSLGTFSQYSFFFTVGTAEYTFVFDYTYAGCLAASSAEVISGSWSSTVGSSVQCVSTGGALTNLQITNLGYVAAGFKTPNQVYDPYGDFLGLIGLSGAADHLNSCNLLGVYGNESLISYNPYWVFDVSGTPSGAFGWIDFVPSFSSTPSNYQDAFVKGVYSSVSGATAYDFDATQIHSGYVLIPANNIYLTSSGFDQNFYAACDDPLFGWTVFGDVTNYASPSSSNNAAAPTSSASSVGTSSSFDYGSCFSNAGFGFDPSSWAPGLLNVGGCILQWLFIPPSNNSTWNSFVTEFENHIPFLWVSDFVSSVNTLKSGINTAISYGACSPPSVSPFSTVTLHNVGSTYSGFTIALPQTAACGGVAGGAGELFGYRVIFRNVMAFMLYLATFALCWSMVPFAKMDIWIWNSFRDDEGNYKGFGGGSDSDSGGLL